MEASSIKDRAEQGEHENGDDDVQLFPTGQLEGDRISPASFRKKGKDVKAKAKIKAIAVPGGNGYSDPERLRTLLVTVQPGKTEDIPHMRDGAVDYYDAVQHFVPTYVEGVQRGDAGRLEASFAELLEREPKAAAAALDALQKKATEVIGS